MEEAIGLKEDKAIRLKENKVIRLKEDKAMLESSTARYYSKAS